jgi:hypothetical protein
MGMSDKFDDMKDKAKDQLGGDEGAERIDQAADKADEATGGKHSEQIDKGSEAAKERAKKLGG